MTIASDEIGVVMRSPTTWILSPTLATSVAPVAPLVLAQRVLERDQRVVRDELLVERDHLVGEVLAAPSNR